MQLGFVSAILPDYSFEQVLGFAREAGYNCVEVMCWPVGKAERRYAGVTHIDVTQLDERQIAQIQELTAKTGVAISGLGYYPNLLAPDAAEREVANAHLRQVILAAPKLGLSVVSTFVGRNWKISFEEYWPLFRAVWPDLIRFANGHGVQIAIENCPMLFTGDEWPGGKNLAACSAIWRRMFEVVAD